MTHGSRIAALLVLSAGLVTMPGCVISSHNRTNETGTKVSRNALERLVEDETTENELLRSLGTPSRTMPADAGGTIYVWEHTREHRSSGAVLFVFGGSTVESVNESTSVLVRDGLVRSWWSG